MSDPAPKAANIETKNALMSEEPASVFWILLTFCWLIGSSCWILYYLGDVWDNIPNLSNSPTDFKEREAMKILALLGALGGCLHGIQSFLLYVGNRNLCRSWLLYYLAAPIKGAVLAVIVTLVLRWGIVSQAGNANPVNLNWLGLYALAALSGMFANQAIEKLADIFNNVLKQVVASNPRSKPADK